MNIANVIRARDWNEKGWLCPWAHPFCCISAWPSSFSGTDAARQKWFNSLISQRRWSQTILSDFYLQKMTHLLIKESARSYDALHSCMDKHAVADRKALLTNGGFHLWLKFSDFCTETVQGTLKFILERNTQWFHVFHLSILDFFLCKVRCLLPLPFVAEFPS